MADTAMTSDAFQRLQRHARLERCVGDARAIPQPGKLWCRWVTPYLDGQIKGAPGTQHW